LTPSYTRRLRAESVGGLKAKSAMMVSGVPMGRVVGTELAPQGKGVTVFLKIDQHYRFHRDAEFVVEQIGLLGDQYVVVYPTRNQTSRISDFGFILHEM
jgi:phospholipid/cholesterol/gamma-HCH transport system substrate-binding protein